MTNYDKIWRKYFRYLKNMIQNRSYRDSCAIRTQTVSTWCMLTFARIIFTTQIVNINIIVVIFRRVRASPTGATSPDTRR